jgi:hypothetical protein
LVDVQTRQFEVRRRFDSFDDFWRTTQGRPQLRDRVCESVGAGSDGSVLLQARSNAVKGRKL